MTSNQALQDPHHLTFTQPRALGRRVSDEFTVPACRVHHRELHRSGDEVAWWRQLSIDPLPVALKLWQQSRADGQLFPSPKALGRRGRRTRLTQLPTMDQARAVIQTRPLREVFSRQLPALLTGRSGSSVGGNAQVTPVRRHSIIGLAIDTCSSTSHDLRICFHSPIGTAFADIKIDGRREHGPSAASGFGPSCGAPIIGRPGKLLVQPRSGRVSGQTGATPRRQILVDARPRPSG